MTEYPRVTEILQECGYYSGLRFVDPSYMEFGQNCHLTFQYHLKGTLDVESLDNALKPYLNVFKAYLKENVKRVFAYSKRYNSQKYKFTGEIDILYLNNADQVCIDDFKISKSIQKSYALQLAGYKILVEENEKYGPIYKNIILINDKDYKIKPYNKDNEKDELRFLTCLEIYNNIKEY